MKKGGTLLAIISIMTILVLLLAGCAQQVETALTPSSAGASSTLAPIPNSYRLDVPRVYAGLKDINEGNQ